jgi:hypothetical protein
LKRIYIVSFRVFLIDEKCVENAFSKKKKSRQKFDNKKVGNFFKEKTSWEKFLLNVDKRI